MSRKKNLLGKAGEGFIQSAFLKPTDLTKFPNHPEYLFDVAFLGEKNELFDLLVYLVDKDLTPTGPHFFVQVKTTSKAVGSASSLPASFSAAEVKRAQAFMVPSYLVALSEQPTTSHPYIRGISSSQPKGIRTVSTKNSLLSSETRVAIYDEVTRFFNRRRYHFASTI